MSSPNSKASTLHDPIDSLESNFKAVGDYLASSAPSSQEEKPSHVARAPSFVSKAGTMIKKYPLAAIGAAFGAGYLFVRLLRR